MKKFLFLFILSSELVWSYSINRGIYGEELYWENTSQPVYMNTANSSLLSSSSLISVLSSTRSELSSQGITVAGYQTTAGPSTNRNDIYFTSDTSVFGGGTSVLGLTKVSFEQSSGKILEADILINDLVFFTSSIEMRDSLSFLFFIVMFLFVRQTFAHTHSDSPPGR